MKIMSFFQRAGVAAVAAAFLLSPAMTVPAEAQTKLRLAVETTPGDPLNVMLAAFRDELQKTAGDEVAIEFFEGGSLGDESALTDMVRVNRVQVLPMGSDIVQLDDKFSVFDVPFLFTDKEVARKALDGELGEVLRKSLRDKARLEVLAFGELGFRVISNNVRPTLLHKSGDGRGSPFPGRTYPTASVTGMPSAVYPFRTAIRTWSSAT